MNPGGQMEFQKTVLDGVEIKRCHRDAHAYKPHVHNELSLGYIVEGSTDLTINNGVVRFAAGDGILIPPRSTHMCSPHDEARWAYVMLFVDPARYLDNVHFHQAMKLTGAQTGKLKDFIEQLLREDSADALENILIELLLEFGGACAPDAPEDEIGGVEAIHAYLLDHVREEITLNKLERVSGLNKFLIIRNFKRQFVTTPAAFHLQCRVAEAKELLSQGADVLDVTEELGFYDQAHFIREFKKMYGVTPGRYAVQVTR